MIADSTFVVHNVGQAPFEALYDLVFTMYVLSLFLSSHSIKSS